MHDNVLIFLPASWTSIHKQYQQAVGCRAATFSVTRCHSFFLLTFFSHSFHFFFSFFFFSASWPSILSSTRQLCKPSAVYRLHTFPFSSKTLHGWLLGRWRRQRWWQEIDCRLSSALRVVCSWFLLRSKSEKKNRLQVVLCPRGSS